MRAVVLLATACLLALSVADTCESNWPSSLPLAIRKFVDLRYYTDGGLVLRNGKLIDPSLSDAKSYPNSTLVMVRGIVTAVGLNGESPAIPADSVEIDLGGATMMPGLVGMHEHMFYPAKLGTGLYSIATESAPKLYLSQGVTSARTAGTMHPYADLNLVTQIEQHQVPGPRIFPTAPYLDSYRNPLIQVASLTTRAQAEDMVSFWRLQGFTNYKAYMYITKDMLEGAIEVAHALSAKVTAHLCSVTFSEAIDLGIDCLEHGLFASTDFVEKKEPDECPNSMVALASLAELDLESQPVQALIHKLVEHNVTVTSTLSVFETFVAGREGMLEPDVLDKMLPQAREQYVNARKAVDEGGPSLWNEAFKKEMEFERMFVSAGGLLQSGCDPTGYGGVIGGYGDIRNVELLVEAGLSPIGAIKVSSTNGAKYLGLDKCIGTLQVGAVADVLVVDGDPEKTISDMRRVKMVVKDGVVYDSAALSRSATNELSWV